MTGFQYVGEICRYLVNQPERPGERDHRVRVMMGAGMGRDVWNEFARRFGVARILEGWSSTEANTSLMNVDNHVGSCGRIPFPGAPQRPPGPLRPRDATSTRATRTAAASCARPARSASSSARFPDLPDSGAGRFEGYTDAAATERKILRDVFQKGDRWYRSGDLLRCDADGYYYFVDRIGDTYRWKSENVSTQEVAEALGGFPGLEIANVYGVRVPGAEGRAGMAALVLRDRAAFDGAAFFAWVDARLPAYAAPLFVRLAPEPDVTSTFKLRKVDLQREGYDPARVRDPLFVRDAEARAYVPLDAALAEADRQSTPFESLGGPRPSVEGSALLDRDRLARADARGFLELLAHRVGRALDQDVQEVVVVDLEDFRADFHAARIRFAEVEVHHDLESHRHLLRSRDAVPSGRHLTTPRPGRVYIRGRVQERNLDARSDGGRRARPRVRHGGRARVAALGRSTKERSTASAPRAARSASAPIPRSS